MSEQEASMDFSMVIASTVHDMKNSLSTLSQSHNRWLTQLTDAQRDTPEHGVIEYEFAKLNGMLVQLLGLYKLDVNQLPLRPDYHEMDDFIEGQLAHHQEVLSSRGIVATCEVDALIPLGFFDRELIGTVVANVIVNAIRYARNTITMSVTEVDGQLCIVINDDGAGYPASMIEKQADYTQGINHISGSTGLGLYFAARIAERHQRNGVHGRIELVNGGPLGGGEFRIYLP
jgi:signal transduction histidine kinase